MIGSFSHHKLGNLKIKSALVLLSLYYLCYWSENYATATSWHSLFSVNSFDVTKNLLIMIVFAFLMIATVSMIRKSKKIKEAEINF
jgi:glucan phosphoethanolaminetransferase (alkaline phosphatase superfamily)